MKGDTLSRVLCDRFQVRAYCVSTIETVRTIAGMHETTHMENIALGRGVSAVALLGATLKPGSSQNIAIRFTGSGIMKEIHAQADAMGNIRAYVVPGEINTDQNAQPESALFRVGMLSVKKDLNMREPYYYTGPLQYGDIAMDIAWYLTVSEQVPSAIMLGCKTVSDGNISVSGGLLIQTLPETSVEVIEMIEKNITSRAVTLTAHMEQGGTVMEYLHGILEGAPLTVLDESPLRFVCRCGRQETGEVLERLPRKDIVEMIAKDGGAEVECGFCRNKYRFSSNELSEILERNDSKYH